MFTDGHYIMAGDNSTGSCNYNYNRNIRSKEAIFESADIDFTNNICSVTFSYFKNDGNGG